MARSGKITVNAAVISHVGDVRPNNEDNFFFDGLFMKQNAVNAGYRAQMEYTDGYHLFGICDGMGGLEGGERAAYIGVSGMQKLYRPMEERSLRNQVSAYVMKASEAVLADAGRNGKGQKEGTTMVLLYLRGRTGYVANVGDSRVYLLRQGSLSQISKDHSQVYQMMLRGELTREQMRKHPRANAISHYMGIPKERIDEQYINYEQVELENNDRFLICSDGLSDLLSFEKLEEMLAAGDKPLYTAERLVQEALELSGKDNTTVLVIDVSSPDFHAGTGDKLPGMDIEENSPTAN